MGPEETQDGSADYVKSTVRVGLLNLQRLGDRTKGQRKWTPLPGPACWSWDRVRSYHRNKAHDISSPWSRVSSLTSAELQTYIKCYWPCLPGEPWPRCYPNKQLTSHKATTQARSMGALPTTFLCRTPFHLGKRVPPSAFFPVFR